MRTWSKWPDISAAGAAEIEGEGNIICTESRFWRCGDGFGGAVYLEIVRDKVADFSGVGKLDVSPKTSNWETASFGPINVSGEASKDDEIEAKMSRPEAYLAETYPVPRTGRALYRSPRARKGSILLLFMGQEVKGSMLRDVWSFRIASNKETLAILKDDVQRILGRQTGEEVVE